MTNAAPMSLAAAQAELICLLDDLTRRAISAPRMGVALAGRPEDIVVLGFLSLYQTEPVHSYALSGDAAAREAGVRFGALHQTVKSAGLPGEEHLDALKKLASRDDVTLITGRTGAGLSGPFSAPEIAGVLARLPQATDVSAFLEDTFSPLIGRALCDYGKGFA